MPAPKKQLVSEPLAIDVPPGQVVFAESLHSPEFSMKTRSDAYDKLIFVLNGRVRIDAEGQERRELSKGSFFPVSRNCPHSIADLSPSNLLLLCLGKGFMESDPLLPPVWERIVENFRKGAAPSVLVSQEIFSVWRLAILEQLGIRFGHELSLRTSAVRILLLLARTARREKGDLKTDSKRRVRALADGLEKNFFEDWSLDKAALSARLSQKQFTKLFKETIGLTFLQKLTQLRMSHAASLLAQTEQSVLSVAFSCGYQDLSHFYRVFKQAYGKSPVAWKSENARRSR